MFNNFKNNCRGCNNFQYLNKMGLCKTCVLFIQINKLYCLNCKKIFDPYNYCQEFFKYQRILKYCHLCAQSQTINLVLRKNIQESKLNKKIIKYINNNYFEYIFLIYICFILLILSI